MIGTVRRPKDGEAYSSHVSGSAFPLPLDVTQYAAVSQAVSKAEREAGPVDVLVNNAGYGHEGVLKESSMDDLQRQFAANVFGPVAMIKAVLPGMRQRRSGHIINVTSMGGFIAMPGIRFYCGSHFALEGISEALGKETKPFGIHVTALAPGQFRTDWAGRSIDCTRRSIADYDAVMDPIRTARQAKNGNQPGDPDKAAQALLTLVWRLPCYACCSHAGFGTRTPLAFCCFQKVRHHHRSMGINSPHAGVLLTHHSTAGLAKSWREASGSIVEFMRLNASAKDF